MKGLTETNTVYQDTNLPDVSTALVIQFADETGVDVHDLPPLYGAIDPEALNRLLNGADGSLEISFAYCDHRIVVTGAGDVTIESLG